MPPIRRKAADFFDKESESNKKAKVDASDLILGNPEGSESDAGSSDDEQIKPGFQPQHSDEADIPEPDAKNDLLSLDTSGNDKELEELMTTGQKIKPNSVKPISKKRLEKNLKKIENTGVVYISRVPPFMKPAKMRSIMARFGETNRIFLAPEDPKSRIRRIKTGGNKKTMYTEGWVEFVKKRDAKLAAETLNGNIIGGKKGNYYHDDILSVKYLHKFKWHNLTEQIALEAQSRQEKLKAEIAQATAQNKAFIEGVEKKRMQDKGAQHDTSADKGGEPLKRTFDQREVTSNRAGESKKSHSAQLSNVLKQIF